MEHVPQAPLARLGLQLLHHGGLRMRIARLVQLLLVDALGRVDELIHERGQPLLEVPAAVAVLEVHLGVLS